MPWSLALGTGVLPSQLGMQVNWLRLVFYLLIVMALSMTFFVSFCIAFLLLFSVAVSLWSSMPMDLTLGILFSLALGLAYGLNANSARWGLIAGLVYGVLLTLFLGSLTGLAIGAAFLIGYFRLFLYTIEAPLSWTLAALAPKRDVHKLWQFHPARWDELIWFPLPGLDRYLHAYREQNERAARAAILHVQESFRQSWAAGRVLKEKEIA